MALADGLARGVQQLRVVAALDEAAVNVAAAVVEERRRHLHEVSMRAELTKNLAEEFAAAAGQSVPGPAPQD